MTTDDGWMTRALTLAELGRGGVEPNPMVGAVVLSPDGRVVGEGYHERFGQAHAEVNALMAAGEAAVGGTLYVTLEPCCHYGKTPPCTDAVLRSGVRRVVAAMADPFPRVAGEGVRRLLAAGIDVTVGVCEPQARRLNAAYLKLLTVGRPWVHAKWAMTLDGKIATRTGHSKWITGPESRRHVHHLRGLMDAILVGGTTVHTDDPSLTARPAGPRTPSRVVVTASGRLPTDCQLIRTARETPVIVYTATDAVGRLAAWANAGAEVVPLPQTAYGLSIDGVLADLGRRRFTNVFIEGGAGLLGSVFDAGAADEVHVFVAPVVVGGESARSAVGGVGRTTIPLGDWFKDIETQAMFPDVYIHGRRSSPTGDFADS